jgi:hypothetical protein
LSYFGQFFHKLIRSHWFCPKSDKEPFITSLARLKTSLKHSLHCYEQSFEITFRKLTLRGKKIPINRVTRLGESGLPDGFFSNQKSQFVQTSNGRCWYISCPFCQFSGHLAYFMAIWYIFPNFGTFLPVLVCCTTKNLATLGRMFVQIALLLH